MTLRRPIAAVTLLLVSLTLAACAAAEAPGWTYAPPPSATATPEATASASASASTPASVPPSAAPSDSGAPTGATVELAALNIQFSTAELTAPADTAFSLVFDNQDAGIPHNVEIKDASGAVVFKGDIFNGPEKRTYSVPALAAGTYQYLCTVHPNMMGTLTVK